MLYSGLFYLLLLFPLPRPVTAPRIGLSLYLSSAATLENPNIKENLTESWLQGKIAVTEDYMTTIHHYVMFNKEDEYSNANKRHDQVQ